MLIADFQMVVLGEIISDSGLFTPQTSDDFDSRVHIMLVLPNVIIFY